MGLGWMIAGCLFATPAWADPEADKARNAVILRDIDGATVVHLLLEAGHMATLTQDPVGDPLVRGAVEGADYVVLFYDCQADRCGAMQFRAWFDAPGATPEAMNLWNRSSRLGRAYLDSDDDPTLEHNVRLRGGVTPEHLRVERDWFVQSLVSFREMLRSASKP